MLSRYCIFSLQYSNVAAQRLLHGDHHRYVSHRGFSLTVNLIPKHCIRRVIKRQPRPVRHCTGKDGMQTPDTSRQIDLAIRSTAIRPGTMTTTPIPIAIIGSGIFVKEQHLVSNK